MARVGACAATALLVLVLLVNTATAVKPRSCWDFATWGNHNEYRSCEPHCHNNACNQWCYSACRGGECKFRRNHQCCHCYC
ncbi:hypothetical protein E2562_017149 [Oryza meyeriana var. granulata]|uniref:Knottin scorpion toxin-like domain-containing protein n=1 Tax=Oryza meyeriana var. granulata TaxID=110450 RepID=A0A6G1EL43_9ORYZ|nr:hypothetical protein E2562_017149 [Oryza meyeriana var. granulata]